MTKVKPLHDDSTNTTYEPLLDPESSVMFFLSEPAISTITFFQDADPTHSQTWLKERLTLIAKANPWLAGRLVKKKKVHKNLLLAIPQPLTEEDVDALICIEDKVVDALSSISDKTTYETLCEKLLKSDSVVGPGYKLIGKDSRVSKFTLMPVAEGQVALIVSITHAVADGHTYYKIMSQLSGEVEELSASRKHSFVPKSMEAIGHAENKYLQSASFLVCCIKSMLCKPKTMLDARFVDDDKVREWKEGVKTGFISTNDIITSSFSQATQADILLMAINLRKRVQDADDLDAGNYELVLLHDSKSSATPQGIRQTLQEGPPFIRKGGKPLPGFLKTIGSKVSMITNWAFPGTFERLTLCDANGDKSIPIQVHLPVYNPKDIAFPIAIVFRPRPGELAVLYGGSSKAVNYDGLIAAGAPIGEQVSDAMFPID